MAGWGMGSVAVLVAAMAAYCTALTAAPWGGDLSIPGRAQMVRVKQLSNSKYVMAVQVDDKVIAQLFGSDGSKEGGLLQVAQLTSTAALGGLEVTSLSNGGFAVVMQGAAPEVTATVFGVDGGKEEAVLGAIGAPLDVTAVDGGGFAVLSTPRPDKKGLRVSVHLPGNKYVSSGLRDVPRASQALDGVLAPRLGGYVVGWRDQYAVAVQVFDLEGNAATDRLHVATVFTDKVHLVQLAGSKYAVVWTMDSVGRLAVLDAAKGEVGATKMLGATSWPYRAVDVLAQGTDGVVAVVKDTRASYVVSIGVQHFALDGNLVSEYSWSLSSDLTLAGLAAATGGVIIGADLNVTVPFSQQATRVYGKQLTFGDGDCTSRGLCLCTMSCQAEEETVIVTFPQAKCTDFPPYRLLDRMGATLEATPIGSVTTCGVLAARLGRMKEREDRLRLFSRNVITDVLKYPELRHLGGEVEVRVTKSLCSAPNAAQGVEVGGVCLVLRCNAGFHPTPDKKSCFRPTPTSSPPATPTPPTPLPTPAPTTLSPLIPVTSPTPSSSSSILLTSSILVSLALVLA